MLHSFESTYVIDFVIKRFTRKRSEHEVFSVRRFAIARYMARERASEEKLQFDEIREFSWTHKRPCPAGTPCTGCASHSMHEHACTWWEIVVHYICQDRDINSSCSYIRDNEYVRAPASELIHLSCAR